MKSKKRKFQNPDLNYILIKDKHGKEIIKKILFSRVVLTFLMLLIQILIFLLFVLQLSSYIEYYFAGSVLFSTAFMIYLSNCRGKNEFKIAWIVPLVIFPLFGIGAYIMTHTNRGGRKVKSQLSKIKKETEVFLPDFSNFHHLLENYPEIQGLGNYLLDSGKFIPHENNKVSYFPNGEDFFPDMFNALKNAKKFIFIEFFILNVDESWILLLELLEQKISEGVEVRLMYDGLGSIMASTKSYQKYLQARGLNTHIFLPLIPIFSTQLNNRDHRKIVIIDGEIAYTGGVNLSNEYFNEDHKRFKYWKDNAIRIEGSAIQNLTTLFLQTWNIQSKTTDDYQKYINLPYKVHNEPGLVIPYGDDAYNEEDIAENVYLYIIQNAKKYLHITTPYVVIDNQMQDALIFAAKRGVDVSIIVPSLPDHLITFCIGKTFIKTLVENGIHVYLYQKGFIHAKTFISDDKIATVGSVNLDYRSFYHHFECGALMFQTSVIEDIEYDFEQTLNDCVEMKKEDYKKIPAKHRMLGRVFRIFAPLM